MGGRWVDEKWQIGGLSLDMLGMGMTLTFDDLKAALLMPRELLIGFVLQYTLVCSRFDTGRMLSWSGNIALSVLMTTVSTISAVVMTPFLTSKLAGQFVAVDPIGLFTSTIRIVLAPVLLGALLNQHCNALVRLISPIMPVIAVITSAALCRSGFFFGYFIPRIQGLNESSS